MIARLNGSENELSHLKKQYSVGRTSLKFYTKYKNTLNNFC